jgi:hypothetical protein
MGLPDDTGSNGSPPTTSAGDATPPKFSSPFSMNPKWAGLSMSMTLPSTFREALAQAVRSEMLQRQRYEQYTLPRTWLLTATLDPSIKTVFEQSQYSPRELQLMSELHYMQVGYRPRMIKLTDLGA